MSDLCVLPVRFRDPIQASRLLAELATAHAQGEDLGSRVPHIQAGCERLLELTRQLEGALDGLDQSLVDLGLQELDASKAVRQWLGAVLDLADEAQRFVPDA